MLRLPVRNRVRVGALGAFLLFASSSIAQTPQPTPDPHRDATRPPASDPQSPTAPPGQQQPAPQTPPGTPMVPGVSPQRPTATPSPTPVFDPTQPPGTRVTPLEEPRDPVLSPVDQKPIPPAPDMSRLGVTSDNTLTLSLHDTVRLALENNNDIEVARDDVRFAETQLRALEGFYEPIFSITPQVDRRIQPQQSVLGGSGESGTTATTTYSFSPGLSKSFQLGGGSYQLTFSNNRTETSSRFSFLNPYYSSNLGLTFTQPLLRNRSIDSTRRQIRIQKTRLEQSDADFRRRTIDVISQVQRAYWDLVFALRDQQNQLANVNLTRENLRRVEAEIAAGTKAPLERAEVYVELANRESALLVAVQNVSFAENNLKQLIFRDTTSPQWSAQITPTETPSIDTTPIILDKALEEARENRPELQRLRLQRDISSIDIQFFKNQTRPRIDLQSTVATTGLAGSPFPCTPTAGEPCPAPPANLIGGYGQTLSNLFKFNTYNVVVGVAIQFPFTNKTAKAELAGARIQQNQLEATMRLQEQAIEVDVRNSAQAVETARRRVLAAREARQNAELQLEGEQRLYQVGRSTTFLLFQRENALTNARNQELRAETDYNKALAELQRATSTTLRSNNIVVDSPTP